MGPRHAYDCGPLLVVDDDEGLRAFVCDVLRHAGYATAEAGSGREALELARSEAPRLLVLDVQLPGLSGYEICRRLRDDGSTIPILLISGERTHALDRVAGLLLGGDDYLLKPFGGDELLARVLSLLRRSAAGNVSNLTPREVAVMSLIAEGLGHAEIGRRLVISPKTVGTHVEHIYEKLGVHNRAQALTAAYRQRVIARP